MQRSKQFNRPFQKRARAILGIARSCFERSTCLTDQECGQIIRPVVFPPCLKNQVLHMGHGFSGLKRLQYFSRLRSFIASDQKPRSWRITMKKFLLGTVGLVALGIAAPASAADLAARPYTKAPPPVLAPMYDWSGFYIGANGGWGESRNCWGIVPVAGAVIPDGCIAESGGLLGGQVGYRWQAGQFVFGLEAQGDWANLHGSHISVFDPAFTTGISQRLRPFHRPDRLCLECDAVVREGRRGGDEQQRFHKHRRLEDWYRLGKFDPLGWRRGHRM